MLLKLIFIVYNIICNKGGRRTVSHNCFISFKKEDAYYKDEISKKLKEGQIQGKSLDKWIDSEDIELCYAGDSFTVHEEYLCDPFFDWKTFV